MGVKFMKQRISSVSAPQATPRAIAPASAKRPMPNRSRIGVGVHSSSAVLLSILVPTVPGREAKLGRLLASLDPQVNARSDIELLVLRDTRGMTIGEKRTRMVSIARGEYVAFVDDDDAVAADYVQTIVVHLAEKPDVVCFDVIVHGHGAPKPCHYGLTLGHENLSDRYHRKPNHLMVWRREIAASVPFPSMRTGEDTAWANLVCAVASKEVRIPRILYTYDYDPADNSATPRPLR